MARTETFGAEKYSALDFLRGIAALLVAVTHFTYGGIKISPESGGLAVGFFFVLSGFVLTHAYSPKIKTGDYGLREFTIARIARLYPLHFVTFVLVAFYWAMVDLATALGAPINLDFKWSLLPIVENLTLTHLLLGQGVSFNSPAWSISVEFWCGLYVFFLCLSGMRLPKAVAILLVLAAFAAVEQTGGFLHSEQHLALGFLEKNYVTGLACFTLGWAIYGIKTPRMPVVAWSLAALLFGPLLFPAWDLRAIPYFEVGYFLAFAVLIVLFANAQPQKRWLRALMDVGGEMSYGIYLWHVPIMLGITAIARAVEIYTGATILGAWWLNIIYFGLLLPTAWASYRVLEMPGKRWIRKVLSRPRPMTA